MKTFWFDGESAAAHGLMISGSGTFDAAERDVEMVSIPGRSGDLIVDNGRYKNIPVTYPASISTDFPGRAEGIRAWLGSKVGYCRLEDDYDPDHFRLGRFQGPLRFTPGFLNRTAECTLTFSCKPQRFLKSGERPVQLKTSGRTALLNPTGFPAKPLFYIKGTGNFYLDIYGDDGTQQKYRTDYSEEYDHVYFDMERLFFYSMDGKTVVPRFGTIAAIDGRTYGLSGGFVAIDVSCSTGGAIETIEMTPRWWTL